VSVLDRVAVVLLEPQNPVNIAATVRAMRNMGLATLRLVRPTAYTPEQIETIAHDTMDLVAAIRHFDTLDAALADCVDVVAYTARRRAAKRVVLTPREAAVRLVGGPPGDSIAVLFGREDAGLPNDALDRANAVCTIPTTSHGSINLAQAVMIAAYELHLAAGDATRAVAPPKHDAPPATATQYGQLFEDVERALAAIDFFKTRYPEHVMRTARSLAYRAAPTAREIELARAMAIEVLRTLERARIISPDS